MPSGKAALIVLFLTSTFFNLQAAAQSLTIAQAPGGIAFLGSNPAAGQFGAMNALAIGAPAAGVTAIALTNGALYYTPYRMTITVSGNHSVTVTALIKINFTHPAALILESCPTTSACNTAGAYSTLSTTAPVTVLPRTANNNAPVTATAGLAVMIPDNNGATAFAGTDTATVTLTATDENNGKIATADINLNSPTGETLQTAVQLTLGTASGGLALTPGSDYAANYGNVNGLGIGAASGLSTVSVSGGTVYSTPYLLNPVFADFSSTTATIKAALAVPFAHPAVLQLDDSGSSAGPFTQITSTPLQITNAAADRGSITRYLGLFVSNANGAGAFTGSDNATLTFTLTVP